MFHDTFAIEVNKELKGKVFSFEVESIGLTRSDRKIITKTSERDDCLACPEFDHCYKFCIAKLTLESAIATC